MTQRYPGWYGKPRPADIYGWKTTFHWVRSHYFDGATHPVCGKAHAIREHEAEEPTDERKCGQCRRVLAAREHGK